MTDISSPPQEEQIEAAQAEADSAPEDPWEGIPAELFRLTPYDTDSAGGCG